MESRDIQVQIQLKQIQTAPLTEWDKRWMHLAGHFSSWSRCASRNIGAILVGPKNTLVSIGYNGAPRGSSLCQNPPQCPRRVLGFKSGEGREYCPAIHAEVNAIINAARIGTSTVGTTMYAYCCLPCINCMGSIINAGITRLVCFDEIYDQMSVRLLAESGIVWTRVREDDLSEESTEADQDRREEISGKEGLPTRGAVGCDK